MHIHESKLAFYDRKINRFRCNNVHHCPRRIMFSMLGEPHHKHSPLIDDTYDKTLLSAYPEALVWKAIKLNHSCPNSRMVYAPKDMLGIYRTVLSTAVARRVVAGDPIEEDVLTALTLLAGDPNSTGIMGLHYVQPRPLYSFNKVLPVFYRPFRVGITQFGVGSVNGVAFPYPATWGIDGITVLSQHLSAGTIPELRPFVLGFDDAVSCALCHYREVCDSMDNQERYHLPMREYV